LSPIRKFAIAACLFLAMAIAVVAGFWARPLSYFNALLYVQLGLAHAHSDSVMVAGYRMHYYVMGPEHGSPVVLVHGLGGRCEDWRNLAPYLVRAGHRVYLPDLPGYGRSEKPVDFSYSISDEAAAVVGFMDAQGLKQVDLGGWSMGGWIVQRVAAEHPERVARLMLFDSAGIYEAPAWDTRLFTPASSIELEQLDKLLMPNPPQVPDFIAADIVRVSQQNAWVIHRALTAMLTGQDATDALLPKLKMPVLIVWGSEDHITPPSQGETMHRLIPNSQLDIIAGCGHLAPVQCATRIGPTLADFVKP
jgi:pimeloyl-ACP methyl ester carboxylesterase